MRVVATGLIGVTPASEYIKNLESNCKTNAQAQGQLNQVVQDVEVLKRENDSLRAENTRLYHEMNTYRDARHATAMGQHYAAPPPVPAPIAVDPNRSLPPLNNGVHASSMQGVQYGDSVR